MVKQDYNLKNLNTLNVDINTKYYAEIKNEKSNAIASGSGVVISEHWVLTAAHVVDCMEEPFFFVGDRKYNVTEVIANSDFDANTAMSSGDIALCYVEEKIDLDF